MLGRITLKLPIVLGGGVFIKLKRKIGFSFDRRCMWLFTERHQEISYDFALFSKYKDKHQDSFIVEYIYCAYLSWCEWNRKKPISERKFFFSFQSWEKEAIEKLLKCWGDADRIGYKDVASKKKVE